MGPSCREVCDCRLPELYFCNDLNMYTVLRNELDDLCQQQGNYKNLRAKIAEDQEHNKKASVDGSVTVCPIIPYLGMFLTDLTFGEEGNSDYVPTDRYSVDDKVMFNIAKLTLMSKSILQLRSYCAGSYPFAFCKSHHQLLCSLQVCRHGIFSRDSSAVAYLVSSTLFCRSWAKKSATGDPNNMRLRRINFPFQSRRPIRSLCHVSAPACAHPVLALIRTPAIYLKKL